MKINNIKFNFLNWKFILSIVISIVFSYYAFQEFELSKIIKVLRDIQYSYILLAAILLIFYGLGYFNVEVVLKRSNLEQV